MTIEDVDLVFGECARNSGRTSAALNLAILLMIGYFGLKKIYKEDDKKNVFRILITLFAVNHLIHFYFVAQNFKSQLLELDAPVTAMDCICWMKSEIRCLESSP